MWAEFKHRIGPFVALLDARYLPLLVAVAPQAYAVYAWLLASGAPEDIAKLGGVGFEMVYVGAIAWAEDGRSNAWTWLTAIAALIFSVAVAVYHYWATGMGAWLHAGFPLVAFCYTLQMHAATHRKAEPAPHHTPAAAPQSLPASPAPLAVAPVAPVVQDVPAPPQAPPPPIREDDPLAEQKRKVWEGRTASPQVSWPQLAAAVGKSQSTIRDWYNSMRAAAPQMEA